MHLIRPLVATAILIVFSQTLLAQATQNKPSQPSMERGAPPEGERGREGGERRGPPPEALAACKSAKANAACSFKGRGGETVKGTCWTPDSSKPLACKPAGGPPSMRGEPGQDKPQTKSQTKQ